MQTRWSGSPSGSEPVGVHGLMDTCRAGPWILLLRSNPASNNRVARLLFLPAHHQLLPNINQTWPKHVQKPGQFRGPSFSERDEPPSFSVFFSFSSVFLFFYRTQQRVPAATLRDRQPSSSRGGELNARSLAEAGGSDGTGITPGTCAVFGSVKWW